LSLREIALNKIADEFADKNNYLKEYRETYKLFFAKAVDATLCVVFDFADKKEKEANEYAQDLMANNEDTAEKMNQLTGQLEAWKELQLLTKKEVEKK